MTSLEGVSCPKMYQKTNIINLTVCDSTVFFCFFLFVTGMLIDVITHVHWGVLILVCNLR